MEEGAIPVPAGDAAVPLVAQLLAVVHQNEEDRRDQERQSRDQIEQLRREADQSRGELAQLRREFDQARGEQAEQQRQLRDQIQQVRREAHQSKLELTERLRAAEASQVRQPDYARGIVKKGYTAGAMTDEYRAEEDGWIWAQAHSQNNWFTVVINGHSIDARGGEGSFFFIGGHASVLYPVKKGDTFKLVGGDYHGLAFYPYVREQ
jgi:hypothetical protein